ncbi:type VI secretion system protein ImpH [Pseudoalteromonas citrea]|uniref:Type VI secretion system protein ImpH n=2 Tax=Pseudoalteromonas citrea TaxID=43655 RepID=A0AAD4AH93_9GAMM|nr:type VI secretion system protein ImpH [Pseudoalteromonas citrea]
MLHDKPFSPHWAKLPEPIAQLLNEPWRFSLFKAMGLLEQHWAINGEVQQGVSQRVKFKSFKELGFPATDVRACYLDPDGSGTIVLESAFLGLYGVDAPMPHYVLEQAANDEEVGQCTRVFLDMFNHVLYCQIYQAWKKSQLTMSGIGSNQFDDIMNAVLAKQSQGRVQTGIASLKQTSAAGLTQLLKAELAISCIEIDDTRATWHTILQPSKIGDPMGSVLGDNMVLGKQALATGTVLFIELGPMSAKSAQPFYPNEHQGQLLARLLQSQLPHDLTWQVMITTIEQPIQGCILGQPQYLGKSTCLGQVVERIQKYEFTQQQYLDSIDKES